MDHGRKINRMKMKPTSKRSELPFVGVTDTSLVKDEPPVEDNRLINWKRWLRRRQKQYQALDESGSKSKTDMIMNSCEFVRPKMEMRNLMECAISTASSVPEKNGGDPGFWKLPPFLSNHGNLCPSEVGPVLTKKELNLLPVLEYVDVPTCVREEKNLLTPAQKVPAWKRSRYLKEKEQELADYITMIQPSAPELASLEARGRGFGHKEEYVAQVPVISVMDTSLDNGDLEDMIWESPVSKGVVVAMKIQNVEITRDEQSMSESSKNVSEEITWTLNFSSKMNERSEQYLHFENTGTVAIIYHWRKNVSSSTAIPLSSRNHSGFFFNKNKALILPGQKAQLAVWFLQRQVGIFSESWRMETVPAVSRAAFVIHMCGYTQSEDSQRSELGIDAYLDRCIRNTAVREIIDEIIHNGQPSKPPEPAYKSLYLERRLFQAKNPSYFYHTNLVADLNRLYATASPSDAPPWTLSLIDLRRILLQNKNPDLRHERLKEFSDLCHQSLGVCLFNPTRNTKYAMVYNVLCAFANRMDEESDFVKRNCILTDKDNETLNETRSRFVREKWSNEVFDICGMSAPKDFTILQASKNKCGSQISRSSRNSSLTIPNVKSPTRDHTAISLYREVFYLRIYELLVEAVEQACAVIDSLNNLNELEQ